MAPVQGKILTIALAATVAALLGCWLFFESFLAPAGCCGATWPLPNPLQVERLASHQDPEDQNGALQRATALAILKARPGDVETWLRLAYADRLIHGRLTAEGANALDVSYSLTPYAGPRGVWRVMFVLNNWTNAPERVRRDTLREIKIIKTDTNTKWALIHRTPSITDINGRLVAVLFGVLPLPGVNIQ